jgi:hypothetical protein
VHTIEKCIDEYKSQTQDSKFDIVYSDESVNILVPLNFTASYETAKNTQWCSQTVSGFSMWKNIAILFRIIPKNKGYDKLKLTWEKGGLGRWFLACSRYPEVIGNDLPFDKTFGEGKTIDKWEKICIHNKGKSTQFDKNIEEIQKQCIYYQNPLKIVLWNIILNIENN